MKFFRIAFQNFSAKLLPQKKHEFEKWHAIRASVAGVGDVLAWVAWVVCLSGWRASAGGVGGVLAWVAWVARLRGLHASVGGMCDVLVLVAPYYYCCCYY